MSQQALEGLRMQFEKEIGVFKQLEKDREKYIENRQKLEGQFTENTMVKQELDLLEEDSKVFKLIGAVLVKVDLTEARSQVEKRLEYIQGETKRVEDQMNDSNDKKKVMEQKLTRIQEDMQKILQSGKK
ncbi:unnamed protein product, partial [Mesorhabditis spiculigera]